MPAPTIDDLPELPVFPSAVGRPDQPAAFFAKFFLFLTALRAWRTQLIALTTYLEGLGGSTTVVTNTNFALTVSNEFTSAYILSAIDVWAHRRIYSATAATLTITPAHGFAQGDRCRFTQTGAGQVTIVPGGVTINSRDGALKSAGQFAVFELECVGSSEFDVLGDVTT